LSEVAPYIAAVGIAIAAWVAIHNRRKSRVQVEKDKFGHFLIDQRSAVPDTGVRDFYDRTKPLIKRAVDQVRRVLADTERDSLDRIWKEYEEIPYEDLSADNEQQTL
jgi:hypothetical protein